MHTKNVVVSRGKRVGRSFGSCYAWGVNDLTQERRYLGDWSIETNYIQPICFTI